MSISWPMVLVTALVSAVFTLILVGLFMKLVVLPRLQREMEDAQDEFERRVQCGVEAAGNELLPAFREQVKLGFRDALKATETAEMFERHASVVNRGADLISDRIGDLFGVKKRRK